MPCNFFLRNGWQLQFLDADARIPLPRRFKFKIAEKIRELAQPGVDAKGQRFAVAHEYGSRKRDFGRAAAFDEV